MLVLNAFTLFSQHSGLPVVQAMRNISTKIRSCKRSSLQLWVGLSFHLNGYNDRPKLNPTQNVGLEWRKCKGAACLKEHRWDAHLVLGRWARRWMWRVRRQTYHYLPSIRRYRFILLGNRGTCVNSVPKAVPESVTAGSRIHDLVIPSPAP